MSTLLEQPVPATSAADSDFLKPDAARLEACPGWLQSRVSAAWDEYQALPMPGPRAEAWRYSSSKRLELERLRNADEPTEADKAEAVGRSRGLAVTAAKFIFLNDRLISSHTSEEAQGMICLSFDEALRSHGAVLEQHLMKRESQLGSAKFAALHLSQLRAGTVIITPKDAVLEKPVEVFHWVSGANATIFPHTLIVTDENSSVTVLDHHASLRDEAGASIAVADLVAGTGSRIRYVHVQEMASAARAVHISSTTVGRNAEVQALQLHLGAAFARTESVSDLVGEGARSEMYGVSLPTEKQIVDMRTLQNHVAPHTFSDLLYKNSLADNARTVFSGLIQVAEGAHYTDAYQKCRNLLNSGECEAVSMPGLEINADQVKCSHGATSAPVSEEELFYLKARGISDADSRRLIVIGFLEDVISRLKDEPLVEMLNERIERKFAAR